MTVSKNIEDLQKLLADPFEISDIEWRVQRSGTSKHGGWAVVIAYVTNRAVQQRLDDVFGIDGWENVFSETNDKKGYMCGIKARFGERWITKWDASEYTNIEPLKGAISGAMKRAAVQFGIGRYLYNLEEEWVKCAPVNSRFDAKHNYIKLKIKGAQSGTDAEWVTPTLPEWARPSAKAENYTKGMEAATDLEQLKEVFKNAYKYASSFNRKDLVKSFTATKDRKKAELETGELKQEVEHYAKTEKWLLKSVNDLITTAANESVLNQQVNKLKKQLLDKFRGEEDVANDLIEHLKKSYETRLNTLKGITQ